MKCLKTQSSIICILIIISLLAVGCQQQVVDATSSVSINDFPTPTKSSEMSVEQNKSEEKNSSPEQTNSEERNTRNSMWNMSGNSRPIRHTGKIKNLGTDTLTIETDDKIIEIKSTDRTRITITKLLSTNQLIKEVENDTVGRISVSYERNDANSLTAKHIIILSPSRQQNNPTDTPPPGRARRMGGGQGMSEDERTELQRRFQEGMSEEQRTALQQRIQEMRDSRANQTTNEEQSTRPIMGNISKIDTKEFILETDKGPITVELSDKSLISKTSSSLLTDLKIDTTISMTGLAVDGNTNLIEAISISFTPPEIQAIRIDREPPRFRANQ